MHGIVWEMCPLVLHAAVLDEGTSLHEASGNTSNQHARCSCERPVKTLNFSRFAWMAFFFACAILFREESSAGCREFGPASSLRHPVLYSLDLMCVRCLGGPAMKCKAVN